MKERFINCHLAVSQGCLKILGQMWTKQLKLAGIVADIPFRAKQAT